MWPRYIWYFRSENEKAYEKKVLELADAAGLKLIPWGDNNLIEGTDFLKLEIRKHRDGMEDLGEATEASGLKEAGDGIF